MKRNFQHQKSRLKMKFGIKLKRNGRCIILDFFFTHNDNCLKPLIYKSLDAIFCRITYLFFMKIRIAILINVNILKQRLFHIMANTPPILIQSPFTLNEETSKCSVYFRGFKMRNRQHDSVRNLYG